MWVTRVELDGRELELDEVLASVTIRHGRAGVYDQANASTLQLTLRHVTRSLSAGFRVGVPLVVDADGEPRFTGTVSDASLDDDFLTVIGVGRLASTRRIAIGAADWPAEPWSQRVERAFAEAGLAAFLELQADPDFDPILVARTADPTVELTLGSYLDELADDVGAAIADLPDGRILVQQLTARRTQYEELAWYMLPADVAWAGVAPACSWLDAGELEAIVPGHPDAWAELVVDPDDVLYAPGWQQTLDLENWLTVRYGDNLEWVVAEPASIEAFGTFPASVSTEIQGAADAERRGEDRVKRRAWARWVILAAPLLSGHPVRIGQVVELSKLPSSSPHPTWRGILEGWVDTAEGGDVDGVWTMELALSDPLYSALALYWVDVPPELAWAEVPPECLWIDATTLDAVVPPARPSYPAAVLELAPVLYWRLDEPAGATVAADSSGNGHDATLYGAEAAFGAPGLLPYEAATSLELGGGGSGVTSSGFSLFGPGRAFTLTGWLWLDPARSDWVGVWWDAVTFAVQAWASRIAAGAWGMQVNAGDDGWVEWPGVDTAGRVIQWAIAYDDATRVGELYLDGVSCGRRTFASPILADEDGLGFGDPMGGRTQEFAAFDRVLAAAELAHLHKVGTGAARARRTTTRRRLVHAS